VLGNFWIWLARAQKDSWSTPCALKLMFVKSPPNHTQRMHDLCPK
jgi:hypothetical protein